MKIIKGDLINFVLDGKFDVIIHGCNCFCTMGGGIAKTIKDKFPEAFEADKLTKKGDLSKLGDFSYAIVIRNGNSFTIVNAYTQGTFWESNIQVDYYAIREIFQKVRLRYSGKRIGYPKIGAGLGGGNWSIISKIINEELKGEDHTLVEL